MKSIVRLCVSVAVVGVASWTCRVSADTLIPIPPSGTYTVSSYTPVPGESAYQAVGSQIQTTFWDATVPTSNGPKSGVVFDFKNIGTISSIITGIYFQDGAWLTPPPLIMLTNGVTWQVGGTPSTLPGGQGVFTSDIQLDSSDNQKGIGSSAGINNGSSAPDELQVGFAYMPNMSFTNVVNALKGTDPAGVLKIGYFVQAINYNGQTSASASFVGSGDTGGGFGTGAAPLPASVAGGGVLFGMIGIVRRVRSKQLPA
jgi:hypothetical protein